MSAKEYWDNQLINSRANWSSNPVIHATRMRRYTGSGKHWIDWSFQDYFAGKIFNSMLSLGCGAGINELKISKGGYVKHIDAFDISTAGIERAKGLAKEERLSINFYVSSFDDFIKDETTKQYDLVMFAGSLHHVYDLEGMLKRVREVMTKDSRLMFQEYTGPVYNNYSGKQREIINRILACFDPSLKSSSITTIVPQRIERVLASDPSESVRSPLIIPLLEMFFEIEFLRQTGGALVHSLYSYLNYSKLSDGSPESNTIVNILMTLEDILTEEGVLDHNFSFGFCKKRK